MSIELGKLGWDLNENKYTSRLQTIVVPRADDSCYVIIPEWNDSSVYGVNNAYGDGSNVNRIKVWLVNPAGSVSLVFNASFSATWSTPQEMLAADVYEDGSLGIAYVRDDNGNVCYRKITVNTWALGSQEVVVAPSGTVTHIDLSISQGDCVAVSFIQKNNSNPKLQVRTAIRSTGGSWNVRNNTDLLTSSDPNNAMSQVSVSWVRGGSGTARGLAVAACAAPQTGDDKGSKIFTSLINESTGAMVNWTLRKTLLAGSQTTKWGTMPRRTYLFSSATNEITVAHMEVVDKKNLLIYSFSYDGTTYNEVIAPQTEKLTVKILEPSGRFAASYSNNTVNFYFIANVSGVFSALNWIGVIDRTNKTVRFSGNFKWDNLENGSNDRVYPMAGTGKYAYLTSQHSMVYIHRFANKLCVARFHRIDLPLAPLEVTPAGGAVMITGTPTLTAKIRVGKAYGQSKYKMVWQFATDSGFTSSLRTYTQPDSKFIVVENTAPAAAFVGVSDTLPDALALTSGTWYVRGAVIDEYGNQGPWKVAVSGSGGTPPVSISHPPSAINLNPSAGATVPDGNVTFTWDVSDALETDTQTAFRLIIENNDTGAVIYDSGKVSSASHSHLVSLDAVALAGILLRWKMMLWDGDDTPSDDYSSYETFYIAAPPTVVIDSPTDGGTTASGTPNILFTPTISGGRLIKAYEVVIFQGGEVVKRSGRVGVSVSTGTQLSYRIEEPLLSNGSYSVAVTVIDESANVGTDTNTFTIAMTAAATPSGVAVSATNFNVEGAGYNQVTWSDANRDANFEAWVIERRDSMLGYGTTVVEVGEWTEIDQVTITSSSGYSYKDYYAPSGYKVDYRVRQLVNNSGDRSISTSEPVATCYPVSEGYWIIDPSDSDGAVSAFRLANVTADSYSPEVEQNEYVVVGWGRHVDQGDYLGVKGSLTAQLRNSTSSTARQKKRQLEDAQKTESLLYLRNPFGDVYKVNLGNLSVSRISGVGRDEFVDVDVPYSEVGSDD